MPSSLFLDTLNGVSRERPPVWFMRQAGRCLPSYQKLRQQYSFSELMETPSLAADVTLLPVNELGVDAAILFSDILVIPQALGMVLEFNPGPSFETPLKDISHPLSSLQPNPNRLGHVYRAIDLIAAKKPPHIPLIGFCGGPLTVFCYMVQGMSANQGFPDALRLLKNNFKIASSLLGVITELSVEYAREQIKHGIEAFQLFETWAGLLPDQQYFKQIMPFSQKILDAVRGEGIPVIFFPRLLRESVTRITSQESNGLSLDHGVSLRQARSKADPELILQGNLDPRHLLESWSQLQPHLVEFEEFGKNSNKWIFNLGHGVLPDTSDKILKQLVEWVKNVDWNR